LGSGFFGLTFQHRTLIFSQIHDIVFYGNGGYDWNTVYNMPIWLRKFTFNKLRAHFEKQQEEMDKVNTPKKKENSIKRPTFTTKASK
jgi:hypothetical protein